MHTPFSLRSTDFEDGRGERCRGLLGKIVADTAFDRACEYVPENFAA
jgi:hypothetical protein